MIKRIIFPFLFLVIFSCSSSGGLEKKDGVIKGLINGSANLGNIKDVHIVNMIRAIGAPNNSIVIDKYKYYQWQYSKLIGVNTLFGGGSTTFYCNMTAETQNNKVKIINWYGNQCGIFLDPINDYFKDKLNIAVISEDEDKKQLSLQQNSQPIQQIVAQVTAAKSDAQKSSTIAIAAQENSEQKKIQDQKENDQSVEKLNIQTEQKNIVNSEKRDLAN